MNKTRKFLLPLSVLAGAFNSEQVIANTEIEPSRLLTTTDSVFHVTSEKVTVGDKDAFSFILKRNNEGVLLAEHSSHASHASHASHRSHTSGY
ncbi:MAG TPA: His-Xaa-Ser repeat protein HxsA2 [Methylophilaceae bacterium]|nr:His-Xaa-Ser repeat protein HxsA2 [Methylophilaceae bacterium]